MNVSRRDFLRHSSIGLGGLLCFPAIFTTCVRSDDNGVDIRLDSNISNLSETVKQQYSKLKDIAENTGKSLRVSLDDDEVVSMSITDTGPVDYHHLQLRKDSNGSVAHVLFGRDGVYPTVRFTDSNGETIVRDGTELEFSFEPLSKQKTGLEDWFSIGITVVAIALAIWIGTSIAKVVFAAFAFLAFNVMVLGLLVAGIAALPAVLEWLFETTGWDRDYILDIFDQAVEAIIQLFEEIVDYIDNF